ncbi:CD225/dispanin family protein [Winogradskyella immobilis]|uniref:CD225/dispanin family protein n=1 Tax=Winogradskyella immobilis TaxID=2816852 RepID=A0ABS8EN36_9FLAO|nr:CD225/dispanin family protein [Winogradskyella immobilis]MCC1483717.1 CD225/dispanin family protein [Winogradskyella immobilis]MCG0015811.1 CD225/dispanin family protein [Winogradskyella immobilis]
MENQSISSGQIPKRPNNYLILGIITTFLCCNVTGVVSIIYAAQVNAKWEGGNYEGAISDSKNAKLWGLIGLIGGFVLIGFVMLIYGAALIAAFSSAGSYNY